MINGLKLKSLLSGLLFLAFIAPVSASGSDDLLAQRGNERSSRSTSDGSSRSSDERPSRPKDERPSRPREETHSQPQRQPNTSYSGGPRHHGEPPHHHHGHGGTVVVVEEPVVYSSAPVEEIVYGDYEMDRFMMFVNIGGGMSFRGASGTHVEKVETEEGEEVYMDDEFFVNSLSYSFELRFDVGVGKHFFVSPGIGFAKQSFYDEFSPGNYMINKKRFLDMPLFIGFRKSSTEDCMGSFLFGPRVVYGINGKCQEYYDFYPAKEHGVFEHFCYEGKYGKDRFSVGLGLEANMVVNRFLLGLDFSLYPKSDCEPTEIYDGLYKSYRKCRKNIAIKLGWRVF